MCGICASIGKNNQIGIVLDGLKKLEYRGYDSSGIAYLKNNKIESIKSVGQIKNLEQKIDNSLTCGMVIGHTRWATHGKVTIENTHPHFSQSGEFAMVHNGIIENYEQIKKELKFSAYSQTDTEVFVNLIEVQNGNVLQKIIKASQRVTGSFAIALLHRNSNKIYLTKRSSPLMVACDRMGCVAASDASVLCERFKKYFILEDDEFAIMDEKSVVFFDKNGKKLEKNAIFFKNKQNFDVNLQEKCFMLKEIKEQPNVLRNTFDKYFSDEIDVKNLNDFDCFHFIACGTAYHSCLLGVQFFQQFCRKPAMATIASEFKYSNQILSKKCLYISVSQSGETADTIACAKKVKGEGCKCLCLTNAPYSTLEQLADFAYPTLAGKEVAVASTKAYTAQVFTLLLLAIKAAGLNFDESLKAFISQFDIVTVNPNLFDEICSFKKVFFIGRQQDYVTALEGALKLKEIAYINCLGIAAGELKHGSLALVDDDTLVIAISTMQELKEKIESNIREVQARGAKVLLVSQLEHNIDVDFIIKLPRFEQHLMPIVSIVPLQMLALEFCVRLGLNPDKPRNLAKSVTVE